MKPFWWSNKAPSLSAAARISLTHSHIPMAGRRQTSAIQRTSNGKTQIRINQASAHFVQQSRARRKMLQSKRRDVLSAFNTCLLPHSINKTKNYLNSVVYICSGALVLYVECSYSYRFSWGFFWFLVEFRPFSSRLCYNFVLNSRTCTSFVHQNGICASQLVIL